MFLSSYRNKSESLEEQEMLWEHDPHCFLFLGPDYKANFSPG